MISFIKSGFTGNDGSLDDARLAAFLLVLSYIGNALTSIIMSASHGFDAQAFGIGAGALAAGIGVWFGQRKDN